MTDLEKENKKILNDLRKNFGIDKFYYGHDYLVIGTKNKFWKKYASDDEHEGVWGKFKVYKNDGTIWVLDSLMLSSDYGLSGEKRRATVSKLLKKSGAKDLFKYINWGDDKLEKTKL